MKNYFLAAIFLTIMGFASCIKPPEYPIEPRIEFVSVTKTNFNEITNDVSFTVTIYFEDGDGDLGGTIDDSVNLFWEDSRVPGVQSPFKIPFIELQGNHKAISGNIYATKTTGCINPGVETDSFTYKIHIIDRAGHESNIIELPAMTVVCD
ncbi:MAG: hypothetical protein H7Y00_15705 [Fimbriimonadaceae bacterium]|nr:hypothetical protein [Chitinophagales bacterium]